MTLMGCHVSPKDMFTLFVFTGKTNTFHARIAISYEHKQLQTIKKGLQVFTFTYTFTLVKLKIYIICNKVKDL